MNTALCAGELPGDAAAAVASYDWGTVRRHLDEFGHALLPGLLNAGGCAALAALYDDEPNFRTRIVMARHAFGRGEYKYFSYPLPPVVGGLREALYPRLAPIANRWNEVLGSNVRFPPTLAAFLARCHAAGQARPTPLMLRYAAGDYNCLHQDLYGDHVFALQVTILLSRPGVDFTGGEFVMTHTRVRQQVQADVIPLQQGDAVIFAVSHRPEPGARGGARKVAMRHGVSRLHSGHRHTLGLIFHDAR